MTKYLFSLYVLLILFFLCLSFQLIFKRCHTYAVNNNNLLLFDKNKLFSLIFLLNLSEMKFRFYKKVNRSQLL